MPLRVDGDAHDVSSLLKGRVPRQEI